MRSLFVDVLFVVGLGAAMVTVMVAQPMGLQRFQALCRPNGTRASYAARATLMVGVVTIGLGFLSLIHAVPHRWAVPSLCIGYALGMIGAFASGATSRHIGATSERGQRDGRKGRR